MSRNPQPTPAPVWRAPGMPALLVLTAAGFAGFAALFPVVPMWAVSGGANEAGAGLVNGLLLAVTVMAQPFVPRMLNRLGTGRVLAAGLIFLGVPPLLFLVSDQLGWILLLSAFRGIGFGILTVAGSTVVANLVPRAQHGAAIGAYGAAIAVPQVILIPAGPWLVDSVGFWVVFALGSLPILGISSAPRLARILREQAAARAVQPSTDAIPLAVGKGSLRRVLFGSLLRPMILLSGVTLAGGALITFAPQMSSTAALTTGGARATHSQRGSDPLGCWRLSRSARREAIPVATRPAVCHRAHPHRHFGRESRGHQGRSVPDRHDTCGCGLRGTAEPDPSAISCRRATRAVRHCKRCVEHRIRPGNSCGFGAHRHPRSRVLLPTCTSGGSGYIACHPSVGLTWWPAR